MTDETNPSQKDKCWSVEWREESDYIWMSADGFMSASDFFSLGKASVALGVEKKCHRVFVDYQNLTTDLSISFILSLPSELESEGKTMTSIVATVLPVDEQAMEFVKMYTEAAIARGHRHKLFKNKELALSWLLSHKAST